eukprot:4076853-Ditylum_brightwellii.AAC.1
MKMDKDCIMLTKYGACSINYTMKRNNIHARQTGKNKRKKIQKKKKVDKNEEYTENGKKAARVVKAQHYITLIDETVQKSVDIKTMAKMLLGISSEELKE